MVESTFDAIEILKSVRVLCHISLMEISSCQFWSCNDIGIRYKYIKIYHPTSRLCYSTRHFCSFVIDGRNNENKEPQNTEKRPKVVPKADGDYTVFPISNKGKVDNKYRVFYRSHSFLSTVATQYNFSELGCFVWYLYHNCQNTF